MDLQHIFQTLEDDGTPIDYVVSESTLNNNVQITIKNLPFYFEKDTGKWFSVKRVKKNEGPSYFTQ